MDLQLHLEKYNKINLELFINHKINNRGGDAKLKYYQPRKMRLFMSACERISERWNSSQARV